MKIGKAKVLQRMVNGTFSDPSFGWETCPSLRNEADVYEEYWHDEFEPDLVVREHDVAFTDVEALDFRDEDTLADQPGPVLGDLTLRDLAESSVEGVWKGVPRSWSISPGGFELDCPLTQEIEEEDSWPVNGDGSPARSGLSYLLLASTLVHVGLVFLLAVTAVSKVSGTEGENGSAMAARLIAPEEVVPQDESPASVDSMAIKTTRAKKTEHSRELPKPEPTKLPEELPPTPRDKNALVLPERLKQMPPEHPVEPEKTLKEKEPGVDKKTNQGSIGSMASAERRSLAAAGSAGDEFESALLSAIRQAVFFPKKAVEKRAYGEVLISFSIGKDGSLSKVTVSRSSGDQLLDEAAIKIVRAASKKFPRLPDRVAANSVGFDIPICFKERK